MSRTIRADQITVGREIAANDGYLFTVKAIVRETPKTITLLLASAFSPMVEIRQGVEKTMRKGSSYRVACLESDAPEGCADMCSMCREKLLRASYAALAGGVTS